MMVLSSLSFLLFGGDYVGDGGLKSLDWSLSDAVFDVSCKLVHTLWPLMGWILSLKERLLQKFFFDSQAIQNFFSFIIQ